MMAPLTGMDISLVLYLKLPGKAIKKKKNPQQYIKSTPDIMFASFVMKWKAYPDHVSSYHSTDSKLLVPENGRLCIKHPVRNVP